MLFYSQTWLRWYFDCSSMTIWEKYTGYLIVYADVFFCVFGWNMHLLDLRLRRAWNRAEIIYMHNTTFDTEIVLKHNDSCTNNYTHTNIHFSWLCSQRMFRMDLGTFFIYDVYLLEHAVIITLLHANRTNCVRLVVPDSQMYRGRWTVWMCFQFPRELGATWMASERLHVGEYAWNHMTEKNSAHLPQTVSGLKRICVRLEGSPTVHLIVEWISYSAVVRVWRRICVEIICVIRCGCVWHYISEIRWSGWCTPTNLCSN